MIVCECRFESFNARGNDEYLDCFAQRLDQLLASGWTLLDSHRDSAFKGWWQIELFKADVLPLEDARLGI
jgi:hypothetical protein